MTSAAGVTRVQETSAMTTVGIFEAKNRLSELVGRASRGEEIVITRRGQEVARLMPPQAPDALGQSRALAARIRHSRAGQTLGAGATIREMIEDGRR
jgi:prevent-host-death family protein